MQSADALQRVLLGESPEMEENERVPAADFAILAKMKMRSMASIGVIHKQRVANLCGDVIFDILV